MLTCCRIADLQCKEVVNLCDGCRLGYVTDVVIDICSGKLDAIVVPEKNGLLGFVFKENEFIIKWENVEKIGDDIILVKYSKTASSSQNGEKRKFSF